MALADRLDQASNISVGSTSMMLSAAFITRLFAAIGGPVNLVAPNPVTNGDFAKVFAR